MPKIIVSFDGVVVREVTLAKTRTTLGRRPYNDVVIDNLAVSGEHAVLHMIGGSVYLEDLDSTNGTYVNAQGIQRQALEHNDIIEIGGYRIRYLASGVAAASAPATLPPPRRPRQATTEPIPLASPPTQAAPLGGPVHAVIRVLSGASAGRELVLHKVVTTVGRPGVAVAAITHRLHGYVVAAVDGGAVLNGEPLGKEAVALQDGDVLDLDDTRMQFVHN